MKRFGFTLLCTLAVAGLAYAQGDKGGRGQGQGRGMGGGFGQVSMMMLASDAKIQEEAKITKDQADKIKEINTKMAEKRREIMQNAGDDKTGAFQEAMKLGQEADKQLKEVLNPDQQKRLRELSWQNTKKNAGLGTLLANKEIQDGLKLSSEQQDTLKAIQDDRQKMIQEMRQGGGGGDMREKMAEFNKSVNAKVEKLLTDDQKKALNGMLGAEYKGEFPRMGGGAAGQPRRKDPS